MFLKDSPVLWGRIPVTIHTSSHDHQGYLAVLFAFAEQIIDELQEEKQRQIQISSSD